MPTPQLKQLKTLLEQFYASDIFGMGEMNELQHIKETIDLVDGAIINNEEE